jgi:hypothetical protein
MDKSSELGGLSELSNLDELDELKGEYDEWKKNRGTDLDLDQEKLQKVLEKMAHDPNASKEQNAKFAEHALLLSWALDGKKDSSSFEKVKDTLEHMKNPNNWKTFSEISKQE